MYINQKDMGRLKLKIVFCLVIVGCFSFACTKEDSTDVNPNTGQTDWTKSQGINEGILNGALIDNQVYLVGSNTFYTNAQALGNNSPFNFDKYISRPGWYKLPVSDKILVTRTETNIYIAPVSNLNESNFIKIDPKDYDSSFTGFEDIPRWQSEALGISGSGVALVPYRTSQEGIAENNPSFFLIKTSLVGEKLTLNEVKLIKPNVIDYYDQIYQIESFDEFFIVNIAGEVLQVNDRGDKLKIGAFNSFKSVILKGELFSFGVHNTNQEITLYQSTPDGKNRKVTNTFPIDLTFSNLKLTTINNEIIGFNNDKIYLIDIESNRLNLTELNNSKLEGGYISSIIQVNEETVLVTTLCNVICGGFTKQLTNFFELKQ